MDLLNNIQNISVLCIGFAILIMALTDPDRITAFSKLLTILTLHIGVIVAFGTTLILMWT